MKGIFVGVAWSAGAGALTSSVRLRFRTLGSMSQKTEKVETLSFTFYCLYVSNLFSFVKFCDESNKLDYGQVY